MTALISLVRSCLGWVAWTAEALMSRFSPDSSSGMITKRFQKKNAYPMGSEDSTAGLQAALDGAARSRQAVTQYCLSNLTKGRLQNVTIVGHGVIFLWAATATNGATRKGLGIVATDGFSVKGVKTAGPLNGFGMEVKNSTSGVLADLQLMAGAKVPGADGLHFFGACSKVTGSNIQVSSGDDALSFTCENAESMGRRVAPRSRTSSSRTWWARCCRAPPAVR